MTNQGNGELGKVEKLVDEFFQVQLLDSLLEHQSTFLSKDLHADCYGLTHGLQGHDE